MAEIYESLLGEILSECGGKNWQTADEYLRKKYDLDLPRNLTVPLKVLGKFDGKTVSSEESEEEDIIDELDRRLYSRGPCVDFLLVKCRICGHVLRAQGLKYHITSLHGDVAINYKRKRRRNQSINTTDVDEWADIVGENGWIKQEPEIDVKYEPEPEVKYDPEPPEKLLLDDDSDVSRRSSADFSFAVSPVEEKKKETNLRNSHSTVAAILSSKNIANEKDNQRRNSYGEKNGGKVKNHKLLPCKDRQFDPDKHCGVWLEEQKRQCTRSLTCKTHALSLRRAVKGRSKAFNQLLQEHRDERKARNASTGPCTLPTTVNTTTTTTTTISTNNNNNNNTNSSNHINNITTTDQQKPKSLKTHQYTSLSPSERSFRPQARYLNTRNDGDSDSEDETSTSITLYPLAANNWHCSNCPKGPRIFSRTVNLFRAAAKSILEPKPAKPPQPVPTTPSITLTSTNNFLISCSGIKIKDTVSGGMQPPAKKLCFESNQTGLNESTRQIGIAQKLTSGSPTVTTTAMFHLNGTSLNINALKRDRNRNNVPQTTLSTNLSTVTTAQQGKGVNIVVASVDPSQLVNGQLVGLQWNNLLKHFKQTATSNSQADQLKQQSPKPIAIVNAQKFQKITPNSTQQLTAQLVAAQRQQQQQQQQQSTAMPQTSKILTRSRGVNKVNAIQPLSLTIPIVQASPNRPTLLVQNEDGGQSLQNNTVM